MSIDEMRDSSLLSLVSIGVGEGTAQVRCSRTWERKGLRRRRSGLLGGRETRAGRTSSLSMVSSKLLRDDLSLETGGEEGKAESFSADGVRGACGGAALTERGGADIMNC